MPPVSILSMNRIREIEKTSYIPPGVPILSLNK